MTPEERFRNSIDKDIQDMYPYPIRRDSHPWLNYILIAMAVGAVAFMFIVAVAYMSKANAADLYTQLSTAPYRGPMILEERVVEREVRAIPVVRAAPEPVLSPAVHCEAVDGDTIWCDGEMIRVMGMDTPETFQPHCANERAAGYMATGFMQNMLRQNTITLRKYGVDKYQRRLADVFIGKAGQTNAAALMIAKGHAVAYNGRTRRTYWRDTLCPDAPLNRSVLPYSY